MVGQEAHLAWRYGCALKFKGRAYLIAYQREGSTHSGIGHDHASDEESELLPFVLVIFGDHAEVASKKVVQHQWVTPRGAG
jgi:hypothetical protein